jgi:hypothetical protein
MHAYTDYTSSPVNLLHFPFIDAHCDSGGQDGLSPPPPASSYVNYHPAASRQQRQQLFQHLVAAAALDDRPPALPPKRHRSRPSSFRSSGDYERRIPILREDYGGGLQRMSQLSDQSASSSSSSEMPKLAEITKLPRLSVAIPIEVVNKAAPATPTEGTSGVQTIPSCKTKTAKMDDNDNTVEEKDGGLLDALNVSDELVYGSLQADTGGGGAGELRAGHLEALVVLATQTIKNDFLYQAGLEKTRV